MVCSLDVHARRVTLEGSGGMVFIRKQALSEGHAASVVLVTASIDAAHAPVTLVSPALLDPLVPVLDDSAFEASYAWTPAPSNAPGLGSLSLTVRDSSNQPGFFRGELAEAKCADGCDVAWVKDKLKSLVLTPAAGSGEVLLTEAFPFESGNRGELRNVLLEGASGRLVCDGKSETIDAAFLSWPPSLHGTLNVPNGLTLSSQGIHVLLRSSQRPEVSTSSPLGPGGDPVRDLDKTPLLLGAVLLAALLVLLFYLRGRKRGQVQGVVSSRGTRPQATLPSRPVKLFYAYAREDAALREKLESHLKLLERRGLLTSFHDRLIVPGTPWESAIDQALEEADVVLLLVSSDFIASDYGFGVELKKAMDRHAEGKTRVVPVLLRPCSWEDAPFGALQVLPKNAVPVTKWDNQDEAMLDIERGIEEVLAHVAR